jgi:uncharacterized protein (DUF1697 family)
MPAYVALLRGINVGGHNILPMQKLRDLLTRIGCTHVATYVQSGNAVFKHAASAVRLAGDIAATIEAEFGFPAVVLVLEGKAFTAIADANPYVAEDPKEAHVWFLSEAAVKANLQRLTALASDDERFELTEKAFYLQAPGGIGRSKLAAAVEKNLGVPATARNGRSVSKICALLEQLPIG